jgi:hypothetical protein
MLFHPFVSVPRNDYLDEDMPDDTVLNPGIPRGGLSCMSDSLPTITLSIIPWQSKTWASDPELCPASEVHGQLEHGQDDVPGLWSGSEAGNCSC